jgi:hypothetical protein
MFRPNSASYSVIASEAKQSILPPQTNVDRFRLRSLSYGGHVVASLLAMTNYSAGTIVPSTSPKPTR